MKKKLAATIFTLAAILGFADEAQINQPFATLPTDMKAATNAALKKSFGYVRMGIVDPDATSSFEALPGIGLGYRYGMVKSAIDLSANYTRNSRVGEKEVYSYTAPRVSYLRYVSSDLAPQSFYYGAGVAWGAIQKGTAADFQGVDASISLGYEMYRTQSVHSFVQFDLSQPAIAITSHSYGFAKAWQPVAEVAFGLGF